VCFHHGVAHLGNILTIPALGGRRFVIRTYVAALGEAGTSFCRLESCLDKVGFSSSQELRVDLTTRYSSPVTRAKLQGCQDRSSGRDTDIGNRYASSLTGTRPEERVTKSPEFC
jgi:hypothetical protein